MTSYLVCLACDKHFKYHGTLTEAAKDELCKCPRCGQRNFGFE